MFIFLFASISNLMLNYFHMCLGIQLRGKTKFMSLLCELYSLILAKQNTFQ